MQLLPLGCRVLFSGQGLGRAWTPWGGEGASVTSSVKQASPTPLTRIDHTLEPDTPSSSSPAWHKEWKNAAPAKTGREHRELFPAPPALLLLLGQLPALPDNRQSRLPFRLFLVVTIQRHRDSESRAWQPLLAPGLF